VREEVALPVHPL